MGKRELHCIELKKVTLQLTSGPKFGGGGGGGVGGIFPPCLTLATALAWVLIHIYP